MRTPHLVFCLLIGLFFSCSAPHEPAAQQNIAFATKWGDEQLREIHELKNSRNTSGLLGFLEHPQAQYRAEAAMALGSVQDTSALSALDSATRDAEPEVRMMAAFALGQLRHKKAAVPLIKLIERDTTTAVRTEALEALGKTESPEAAAFLASYVPRFLFDESGQAWGIYRLSIGGHAHAAYVATMSPLLRSPYEESRLAAAYFFSRYHHSIPDSVQNQLALSAQRDAVAEVRMAATRALAYHPAQNRERLLASMVISADHPGIRVNAIEALTKINAVAVSSELWQGVFDGNPNVAVAAARFFITYFEPGLKEQMVQQTRVHPNPAVRAALLTALMTHAPTPEMANRAKGEIAQTENMQVADDFVRSLAADANQSDYLDSLFKSDNPILATAALGALHEQFRKNPPSCERLNELSEHVLATHDFGMLAYWATMVRDEKLRFSTCFSDAKAIRTAMNNLPLPEAIEAWTELNTTQAFLSGEAQLPMPAFDYLPINWNALDTLPQEAIVVVNTTQGAIKLLLLPEDAPATVAYFLELVKSGYYTDKPFHRVVPNFVVQTGCSRGDGYGGMDRILRSEFSPLHYGPGVVGMASAGKDTESSQWFITHRTTPHLDGRYTIFAAVLEGMAVLWQLAETDRIIGVERVAQ